MAASSLERRLAGAGLVLVLTVVVASAAIRLSHGELGAALAWVRGAHRFSASSATLLIAAVAYLAWRGGRRGYAAALVALTAFLSVLGAATGVAPPAAAQAGNLLGGLALAALLAAAAGASRLPAFLLVVALQAALGAWISIFAAELWTPALFAHALLGLALAGGLAWAGVRCSRLGARLAVLALAAAVPASGAAAALLDVPLAVALAHSVAAALFVCVAATARAPRLLDPHQGRPLAPLRR